MGTVLFQSIMKISQIKLQNSKKVTCPFLLLLNFKHYKSVAVVILRRVPENLPLHFSTLPRVPLIKSLDSSNCFLILRIKTPVKIVRVLLVNDSEILGIVLGTWAIVVLLLDEVV